MKHFMTHDDTWLHWPCNHIFTGRLFWRLFSIAHKHVVFKPDIRHSLTTLFFPPFHRDPNLVPITAIRFFCSLASSFACVVARLRSLFKLARSARRERNMRSMFRYHSPTIRAPTFRLCDCCHLESCFHRVLVCKEGTNEENESLISVSNRAHTDLASVAVLPFWCRLPSLSCLQKTMKKRICLPLSVYIWQIFLPFSCNCDALLNFSSISVFRALISAKRNRGD